MSYLISGALFVSTLMPAQAPDRQHKVHMRPKPFHTAVASVYDAAGGPLACGGSSYGPVVANKTLPCGTRLQICYRRCTKAVVRDRGPFVAGRDFDLSRRVQNEIGFPFGVDRIRYRLLR